jgi:hypothetical protein
VQGGGEAVKRRLKQRLLLALLRAAACLVGLLLRQ